MSKTMKRTAPMEADVSEDLHKKIAAARLALNTALLTGEPTFELRAALRDLEAERKKLDDAAAAQEAAQAAARAVEAQRVDDAAEALAEARNNRLAALMVQFKPSPAVHA